MSENKTREYALPFAALATVAAVALANCPGEKKLSAPSFKTEEVGDRRTVTRTDIGEIFDGIDSEMEENAEEYTVKIDLDENGEVPKNFDYVSAIRDCVESTGKYRCFDSYFGYTTCHNLEGGPENVPVSISDMYYYAEEFMGDNEYVRVDATPINLMNSIVDKKDINGFQNDLNSACRTTVEGLETRFSKEEISEGRAQGHYEYVQSHREHGVEMARESDELFRLLEIGEFNVEDKGGSIFEIDFGNGNKGTLNTSFADKNPMADGDPEFGIVYRFRADGIELSDGTSISVSKTFEDIDESIEFVFATEQLAQ